MAADSGEYVAHSAKTTGTLAESSTSSWKLLSMTLTRNGTGPAPLGPASPETGGVPGGGPAAALGDAGGDWRCFRAERSTAQRRLSGLAAAGGTGREAGELMLSTLATPAAARGRGVYLAACLLEASSNQPA